MRYRADIDGLRALAVIPVVLFHAGTPWFQGGYVGVDVFFVISGYLITSIIVGELDAKSFSLLSFYERRIRRIFPALVVVLAFCLVTGFALLTPADYQTLGQSTDAAALFLSNIFFWKHASYFDVAASEKPLLHTWSLAIEEQYYLFYPLILIALTSISSRIRGPAILLGGLASFAFCAVMVNVKPSATFYLAPARAWELLFGGLIALNWVPLSENRTINRSAALLGLACIFIPVIVYTPTTRFPGITALPPVIGAVLLIWSGFNHRTLVHSWLSSRPMMAIGKVSYSLYLWHYPLLAFAGYMTLRGLGPVAAAAVCLVAFMASLLSLQFVEKPFRFHGATGSIPRIVAVAVAGMAIVVVGGTLVALSDGFPGRMTAAASHLLASEREQEAVHHWECMSIEQRIVNPKEACKLGSQDARPSALLWGDSHAVVTATALEQSAVRNNAAFLFAASVDCPIGLGFSIDASTGPEFVSTPGYRFCGQYNKEMAELALSSPDIRNVVLVSRWTNWRVGEPGSPAESPVDIRLRNGNGAARTIQDNRAIFVRGFEELILTLVGAGKTVWIVGPLPEPTVRVPKALYVKALGFDTTNIDISEESYKTRHRYVLALFDEIARKYSVRFIWPSEALCADGGCPVIENGNPMFFDQDHLSYFGVSKTSYLYDPIWDRSLGPAGR
jgi:peptidoglycan/LPS O-acetylase OafA/YrhL